MALQTYEDAEKTCSQQENGATLIYIRSLEEQNFLSNLLFKTNKVVDTVWIGAKYSTNKFKWTDDSDLSFTNWAEGNPQNETVYDCVQMMQDVNSRGKWVNEPCGKKNLVVCQKMQIWSISRLQKTLLDVRKELNDSLIDAKNELNNIKQNPVPIGFIYVQLPNQPEPKVLWSTVEWKEVTSEYAGVFFRAEGATSGKFGEIQLEDYSRLAQVKVDGSNVCNNYHADVSPGSWSASIFTRKNDGPCMTISFLMSNGELRPRNMAMRIWKRTN